MTRPGMGMTDPLQHSPLARLPDGFTFHLTQSYEVIIIDLIGQ